MEVIAIVMWVIAALFCARWALGPFELASVHSKARIQFTIADILCLFAQIQVMLAILQWAVTKDLRSLLWPVAIMSSILMVVVWWVSVTFLSEGRVRNVWHRVAVIIIGVPLALFGSVAFSGIPVLLLYIAIAREWELLSLAPIVLVMLGLLLGGIRLAIRRIVTAAQSRSEE